MQKIKDLLRSFVDKIKGFFQNKPRFLRYSISLFLTGLILILFQYIGVKDKSNNSPFTNVAATFMMLAFFLFPNINKDKLIVGFAKIVGYLLYLYFVLELVVAYFKNVSNNINSTSYTAIVSIFVCIFISLTLKPIFSTIKFVGDKLKELGEQNHESNIIIGFKKLFSAFGIITAFVISITTIIDAIIGIIK